MSIRGKSEIMSRVLIDEMSCGGGIRVRKRRHAWHASNMQREITCYTCHSVFSSPFLPTLCARAGSIDASLVDREEAALRRLGGQIWSIRATCTVKREKKGNDLKPHFHFSLFFIEFSENPVGQLSTWTRSKEMHWNQMTSIHKMKHLFAGYPSKNQSKKRESRKNCYCDIPGLYRAQSNKCAKMLISP